MKIRLALATVGLGVLSAMAALPAQADGWHHHHWHSGARVGVYFGAPLYWPYYAYPAYPAYPVVREYVYEPRYVEPGPAPEQNWYYCRDSKAYYPYVQDCASGWEAVPAKPAQR